MIYSFMTGFRYPFRAVRFVFDHPSLLKYIFFPFLINVVVFASGFLYFLSKLDRLLTFIPKTDGWYFGVLFYVVAVILALTFVIIAFYAFTVIGNIIASPFNSALSEKTESLMNSSASPSASGVIAVFKDVVHSVGTEIKRLLYFLFWLIPLLLINFIPVIGQALYFAAMLFYTCYALTFSFMDYSLDRRYRSFRQKNKIIFSDKSMMAGFGIICFMIGLIPIVNLFLIPLCVIGATMMYVNEHTVKQN